MPAAQPGILAPIPARSTYLSLVASPGVDPRPALRTLRALADGDRVVVGL